MTALRSYITTAQVAGALGSTFETTEWSRITRRKRYVWGDGTEGVTVLCCEGCGRWWPLAQMAGPGKTEFICRACWTESASWSN